MKVRTKLLSAITALILLMAIVFYTIAHGYLMDMFRVYAKSAEQIQAEQWASMLAYDYRANGDSWRHTASYMHGVLSQQANAQGAGHVERVTVSDLKHQVVAVAGEEGEGDGDAGTGQDIDQATTVPITVYGRRVGAVTVSDTGSRSLYLVATRILHAMTVAIFWGVLSTSVIALVIGIWLTTRITGPLRRLLAAIERIMHGDSRARVHIPTDDEFGRVGNAFNEMTDRWLRTEEARKHLVADVAHELRTPLTVMQGQLELIQEGMAGLDHGTVLRLLDEVMRLSGLVEDLHQLSLAEVGVLRLQKEVTDVHELLSRVLENFELEAETKRVALSLAAVEGPFLTLVDRHRFTQVAVNLIGNAMQHTPMGGRITVELGSEENWLRMAVVDTGKGIDPEHLPHIFDRFYRADEDRSRNTGGMGIGLAIANGYVQAHGGRIEAASEVGKGTTFTVWLPRSVEPAP